MTWMAGGKSQEAPGPEAGPTDGLARFGRESTKTASRRRTSGQRAEGGGGYAVIVEEKFRAGRGGSPHTRVLGGFGL